MIKSYYAPAPPPKGIRTHQQPISVLTRSTEEFGLMGYTAGIKDSYVRGF